MTKYTSEVVAILKAEFLARVADGVMPADAAREWHIDWRTLAAWKRQDSIFAQDLKDATEACADALAAKAVDAHLIAGDAKSAQVMQNGLKWAAERLAPHRYGPRIEIDNKTDAGKLLALLQEGVERVKASALADAAIDVTPGRRIERKPSPQETHRP